MPTLTTSPWQAAVDRLSSKSVVGSRLRSADWAKVPVALRDRAFFSAGVENVRVLSTMREKLSQAAQQLRPGGTGMNAQRFVADMRALLGADPGDSGSLTDLTSVRRLMLIFQFQDQDAHAYAAYKAGMDPDILDAFPAQRLVRIESRRIPRDWYVRWAAAGAAVGWVDASKRILVALKTSPIWTELSRFRRPWPPFDFGSGMGLEDVDREETEALGLLPKREPATKRLQRLRDGIAQAQRDWNEGLQAGVKGLDETARDWLRNAFGDQISIEGDTMTWRGGEAAKIETPPAETPAAAPVEPPAAPARVAPVSDALTNHTRGDLSDEIDNAVSAIDGVHRDGDLPPIPVQRLETGGALGLYQWDHAGQPEKIAIRDEPAAWPGLTTAHEVGHFLDHQVLGTRGAFASIAHPLLAEFRAVVGESEAVREIRQLLGEASYFNDPRELWARAYAQFIATRSGDARLLAQLDRTRRGPQKWRQWSDEDFKLIAAAIEAVLRKKGWSK